MSKRLLELAELRDLAAKRRRLQMQAAREAAEAATAAEAASAEAAGAASLKVRKAKGCMLDFFFARPWTAIWPKPATQQPQPSKPRHTSCTESAEALPFESEQAAFLREEEAGRLLWKSRKVIAILHRNWTPSALRSSQRFAACRRPGGSPVSFENS